MKTELNIEGMTGEPDVVKVRETLELTAGVKSVDVTSQRKTAIVEFDDETVQAATLIKKIQDAGYVATVSGESQSEVGA